MRKKRKQEAKKGLDSIRQACIIGKSLALAVTLLSATA
jgi:hypothetical protein